MLLKLVTSFVVTIPLPDAQLPQSDNEDRLEGSRWLKLLNLRETIAQELNSLLSKLETFEEKVSQLLVVFIY